MLGVILHWPLEKIFLFIPSPSDAPIREMLRGSGPIGMRRRGRESEKWGIKNKERRFLSFVEREILMVFLFCTFANVSLVCFVSLPSDMFGT